MNNMRFLCFTLAISICLQLPVMAQSASEFLTDLERTLREKEPDWKIERQRQDEGIPGPNTPRGTHRHYNLTSRERTVRVYVLYGATKEEAVKPLEQSQRISVNLSRPVEGIGEQAYQDARLGYAWMTFRKSNVMVKVSIGLVDPRVVDINSVDIDTRTQEALEIVKRFVDHIVGIIPAS